MLSKKPMPPDAIDVICLPGNRLRVTFAAAPHAGRVGRQEKGEVRVFDAGEQLLHRKCYAALRNPSVFQTAHIAHGTVAWGDALDIDPEWLYEASIPEGSSSIASESKPEMTDPFLGTQNLTWLRQAARDMDAGRNCSVHETAEIPPEDEGDAH